MSLVSKEMNIKSMVRYHFASLRMAKMKKTDKLCVKIWSNWISHTLLIRT